MRSIAELLALSILAAACGETTNTVSQTSGALNERTPVCQNYSEATLAPLDQALKDLKIFHNFTAAERPELLKHFYAVPPVYRNQMIEQNKKGQFTGFFKEAIASAGVCYFTSAGCTKIALSSTQKGVISFSMIHEIGHGMKGTVAKAAGLTSRQFDDQFQIFLDEGKAFNATPAGKIAANKIRQYSFSGVDEYWADSFHNYYCSETAHNFIKTNLPLNYAFLQKYLPAPVFKEGVAGTGSTVDSPAQIHSNDLLTLFNAVSKTCDLEVGSLSSPSANGDVSALLKLKGSAKTSTFMLNAGGSLASELSKLRRSINGMFADCPME